MFRFGNKNARALDEAQKYIRSMFAGLGEAEGKHLPRQAFTDPYMIGFLQVLTTHSVATVYHSCMPNKATITSILAAALDRLFPGNGTAVSMRLSAVSNPVHPEHGAYLSGRHDGSEHVRALLASYDNLGSRTFSSFRDHVKQHHLHTP